MPVATETVFLRLKDGNNPHDAGSGAAQRLKQLCTTVSQQKGFVRQFWGTQLENQSTLVWTVDWEDVQDHKDFVNSEAYKVFIADNTEIFDLETIKPFMVHTYFTSDATGPRQAPITEYAFYLLPANANDEIKSTIEDKSLNLAKLAITTGSAINYACGWVLEEVLHDGSSNGKAIGLHVIIGWLTQDDYISFKKSTEYMDESRSIADLTLPKKDYLSTCHVKMHGKR